MNRLVSFRLCTLTDSELVSLVDSTTDKMYIEGGKVPPRHIPARPNSDYDLLVGELCVRFNRALTLLAAADMVIELIDPETSSPGIERRVQLYKELTKQP